MNYSKKVMFYPWVGSKYSEQNPKILIVCESVNGDSYYPDPKITQSIIQNIVSQNWPYAFYTKIYKLFCEENILSPYHGFSKIDFWESVSIYHYIQEYIDSPRQRPVKKQWLKAKGAFHEILLNTKPDIVFALAKELFRNLPRGDEYSVKILRLQHKMKLIEVEFFQQKIEDKNCIFVELMHPTAPRFTYQPSRKAIDIALKDYYMSQDTNIASCDV